MGFSDAKCMNVERGLDTVIPAGRGEGKGFFSWKSRKPYSFPMWPTSLLSPNALSSSEGGDKMA